MIQTILSSNVTLLQRVTGQIDALAAEQGATAARAMVQQAAQHSPALKLLLDLRGLHFLTLHAHKTWKLGFTQDPLITRHVRYMAIIGDDTATFRAEQAALSTEQCKFFLDFALGEAWLAQTIME